MLARADRTFKLSPHRESSRNSSSHQQWGSDAETFDLDRNNSGHLGFGIGVHFCLGAALARMEAECALHRLLPLLEKSRYSGDALEPIDSVQFRGVQSLQFEKTG